MRGLVWVMLAAGCDGKDTTEGDPAIGETVFAEECASCHADDGTGGIGPSLYGVVPDLTDGELVAIMIDGTGEMPAIPLEGNEPADVLAYLRETFGPYVAPDSGS